MLVHKEEAMEPKPQALGAPEAKWPLFLGRLGFKNLKEVLEIVVIPLSAVILAFVLARDQEVRKTEFEQLRLQREDESARIEQQRIEKFRNLVYRELHEIEPIYKKSNVFQFWIDYRKKGFVHEEIVNNTFGNPDYAYSLEPDFIYNLRQLWSNIHQAQDLAEQHDVAGKSNPILERRIHDHGVQFRKYFDRLSKLCSDKERQMAEETSNRWKIILDYHFPVDPAVTYPTVDITTN